MHCLPCSEIRSAEPPPAVGGCRQHAKLNSALRRTRLIVKQSAAISCSPRARDTVKRAGSGRKVSGKTQVQQEAVVREHASSREPERSAERRCVLEARSEWSRLPLFIHLCWTNDVIDAADLGAPPQGYIHVRYCLSRKGRPRSGGVNRPFTAVTAQTLNSL